VRLSMEEIQKLKNKQTFLTGKECENLFDTIEVQQQEIDRLQKCYDITNKSWKEQIHANKRQEKAIRNMKAYLYDVEKSLRIAKDALISISEYWNGSPSDIAMMDACTNNREAATVALTAIEKAFGGDTQ
jgi:LPS O-antigen subunit length determinant protein (WzzB/FepE family)